MNERLFTWVPVCRGLARIGLSMCREGLKLRVRSVHPDYLDYNRDTAAVTLLEEDWTAVSLAADNMLRHRALLIQQGKAPWMNGGKDARAGTQRP